ncbi:MAG: PL29 family lyase N-terminal domain-containing protein [Candidatus Cryptobacteroides sp.]
MENEPLRGMFRGINKALAMTLLAGALFNTSCYRYDDSQLKQSIAQLEQQLNELKAQLQGEISALKDMVNGLVTVVQISENQDGSTVVTLSDGQSFTIAKDISGKTLITVIEEGGQYYWATTVDGGEAVPLILDGKMVPVSMTLTPQLKIEEGKWYISLDGGKTWVFSGVEIREDEPQDPGEEKIDIFIAASQDDDYVYLTLADGTVISVAKEKEVSFKVLAGKQYFNYGQTKSLTVEMAEVLDYTITEVPKGWEAEVIDDELIVTAPGEDAQNARKEGVVKMLATFRTSSPVIAKVSVSLGKPDVSIVVSGERISFIVDGENVEYEGFVCGVMARKDFSLASVCDRLNSEHPQAHESTLNTTVAELAGSGYDPSVEYVVYAADYVPADEAYSGEEIQVSLCAAYDFSLQIIPSYDNANVKLSFSGCEGYYAGCALESWWSPEDELASIGTLWGPSLLRSDYEGPVTLFGSTTMSKLDQMASYIVWILPHNEAGVYDVDSFMTYEFTTLPLKTGGKYDAPQIKLASEPTNSSIEAEVSVVAGAYKTYARIFKADELPADESQLIGQIVSSNNSGASPDASFVVGRSGLEQETDIVIAAVAVGEDGSAGKVGKLDAATLGKTFLESLVVKIEEVNTSMYGATVKLAFDGGITHIRYVNTNNTFGLENMEDQLVSDTRWDAENMEISSSEVTLTFDALSLGQAYSFFVVGFDQAGNMSHMAQAGYTPESTIKYIKRSKDNWSYGKPSLGNESWEGGWAKGEKDKLWHKSFANITLSLTMPAECRSVYVWATDPEYLASDTEVTISDKTVVNGILCESSRSVRFENITYATTIYMVWIDIDGNYHSYYDYFPQSYPPMPAD